MRRHLAKAALELVRALDPPPEVVRTVIPPIDWAGGPSLEEAERAHAHYVEHGGGMPGSVFVDPIHYLRAPRGGEQ